LAMVISSAIGALVLVFSKDLGWKAESGRIKLVDETLSS
jgi:hypothetical protein